MNKHKSTLLTVLVLLATAVLPFASCTIETSKNGDLDGLWHLVQIDTLSTGGRCDMSASRVFWGVQLRLIRAYDADSIAEPHYFRFEQTADSLTLTKAYIDHWHEDKGDNGGDIPVDTISRDLRYYGVHHMPQSFVKEALSGSRMVLRSDSLRLSFVKF